MKSNILDMESHQSCEDEGLGDKAEGGDGDEEDEAEDDEKMSASVLSHRPNQVEKEQVLENILLLSINFFNKITNHLENEERIFQVVHQRIRVEYKEAGVETVAEIFG